MADPRYYDDPAILKVLQDAWYKSGYGTLKNEFSFQVTGNKPDGSLATTPLSTSHEELNNHFALHPLAKAIFHTHPNKGFPQPSPNDIALANTKGIPVYALSNDGLWAQYPNAPKPIQIFSNLKSYAQQNAFIGQFLAKNTSGFMANPNPTHMQALANFSNPFLQGDMKGK